ncbi:hypothetical protein SAMN04488126_1254 [Bhargavaea beijingensis]|uniref:Hemerythrin HHE cation binding domain-containing protein n=1 Tax=Bhargavaea beijingensis TaxID=426756 RepID=A0A1G7GB25_9BACL|nr:hypothetical protein [Bhargavaea beijingensis]SDE85229.1 hypothetical protein SAMN04488126_1254 [Bhargavaea beijingensis]
MPGPALKQLHAHHAIHQGALTGAIQKTDEVKRLLKAGEDEVAKMAADHLLEYWETRIIAHADAEEDGFYQEMVGLHPELEPAVTQLTRDHDLLRTIATDIKKMLSNHGLTQDVIQQFEALIVVNDIHSRDEERMLLDEPNR